ncbi:ornithine carbamoyltransferase [candidate division MSBL1 archaeon SCGC-AAA261F17]|uniref:Ornithine carbamoyltransferase n=1 Tax=candidate division MSBL1 archaeon SCGC-AAA261F17 TaxID=1698274 RepID=A0A133V576_9EURY|nr:ornithine carbamoyltransferase [candidate division MSBL1 archaeon SCGC-AAA261F17]
MVDLYGRDLITSQEWSKEEIDATIELAKKLKRQYYEGTLGDPLKEQTFFMLFYNTSTRTRASFEAAMTALGGHAQFVDVSTTRVGEGEMPKDVARMYERYGHGLGIRILESAVGYVYGRGNEFIRKYAENCDVPVISLADDKYHPCQGLADLLTVQEKIPDYQGKKYVISWAYSDKVRSWGSVQEEAMLMSRYGIDVTIAAPEGFELDQEIIDTCRKNAKGSGANFETTNDLDGALEDAHIVFPRSWASHKCMMDGIKKFGKEREQKLHENYVDWKLTQERLDLMDDDAIMMHVLPVFRGQEASDEVVDGPHSIIYDQAENRLHAQTAILTQTMSKNYK